MSKKRPLGNGKKSPSSLERNASILNQLIKICKDGESGFRSAAHAIEDHNLKRLFESYSQERAEFAAELQLEVKRLAEDPVDSGHMTAALHRGWMDIKAGVTGGGDGEIISECERGEDLAVQSYQEALADNLPPELQSIVERQFLRVKEAHDQIRSLEQAHNRHT